MSKKEKFALYLTPGEEGPSGAALSGGWKPEPHWLYRAGD